MRKKVVSIIQEEAKGWIRTLKWFIQLSKVERFLVSIKQNNQNSSESFKSNQFALNECNKIQTINIIILLSSLTLLPEHSYAPRMCYVLFNYEMNMLCCINMCKWKITMGRHMMWHDGKRRLPENCVQCASNWNSLLSERRVELNKYIIAYLYHTVKQSCRERKSQILCS